MDDDDVSCGVSCDGVSCDDDVFCGDDVSCDVFCGLVSCGFSSCGYSFYEIYEQHDDDDDVDDGVSLLMSLFYKLEQLWFCHAIPSFHV